MQYPFVHWLIGPIVKTHSSLFLQGSAAMFPSEQPGIAPKIAMTTDAKRVETVRPVRVERPGQTGLSSMVEGACPLGEQASQSYHRCPANGRLSAAPRRHLHANRSPLRRDDDATQ